MKIGEFQDRWHKLNNTQSSYQRIDAEHPLDFFMGKGRDNLKELVLITEYEPSKMKSSKSVDVIKGKRNDGKWAIQIKLSNRENEDVFMYLCWDLVESSRTVVNSLQGLEKVISRFIRWQKLMELGSKGLSDSVIKGIIGELIYAKKVLVKKYYDVIIGSWLGPDGADRDYVFHDTWAEIKTTSTGSESVTITSVEQLDVDIVGTLCVAFIDSTSSIDVKGFTFYDIILDFRDLLSVSPEALYKFEEKLISLGYYYRKEYEENHYIFGGFKFYCVNDTFPKITRDGLRSEISTVKYSLPLSNISNWQIEEG